MLTNKNIYLPAIVLSVVLNVLSWHLPFFWDTILTSTITQYFFEHGFHNFITPAEFDAGHPPLFYVYVTCFYHIFGKSLFAAHLSILPFTILGIVSFISLLQHFSFTKQQQFFGVLFFFSIPAVITQNTLVSYDAVLLSLYLAALAAYFKKHKLVFILLVLAMVSITLRGIFCVVSLSATVFFIENKDFKKWFKWNLSFVPAIVIISTWYIYHYTQTGWLFATKSAGWSEQRGFVDALGLFKNGISIARCFFDLGIFALSFFSLLYLLKIKKTDKYILLCLIPALVFSISFLPFTNPINHRYYLIVYVLMIPVVVQFLSEKKLVFSILTIVVLWLGNLQIYPVPISNGWDCTLTHLSYFKNREKAMFLLEYHSKFINKSIGSVFPMNASMYQTNMIKDLDDSVKIFNVNGSTIDSMDYVLFSNVGNDFSDEQIHELRKWKIVTEIQKGLVYIILYQNPKNNL